MRSVNFLVVSFLVSAAALAQEQPPVTSLSWLAGCWRADGAEAGSNEHWLAPAGGTMLGVARTVKGGKTVSHEFMQIRANEQGKLVFIAAPSGQTPATFPLSASSENAVTFENPAHDFPQRVIYKLTAPDKLGARIEGMRNGNLRGIDFPMTRC
jgi:hypothetical protein